MDRAEELAELIRQQARDDAEFHANLKANNRRYTGVRNSFATQMPSHGPPPLHDGSNDPYGEDTW